MKKVSVEHHLLGGNATTEHRPWHFLSPHVNMIISDPVYQTCVGKTRNPAAAWTPCIEIVCNRKVTRTHLIDHSRSPLKIAQRGFDRTRVLRVVYREENGTKTIITSYPGRRRQYEKR